MKLYLLLLSGLITLLLQVESSSAQNMSSPEYKIEVNPKVNEESNTTNDTIQMYGNISEDIHKLQSVIRKENYTVQTPYISEYGRLPIGISVSTNSLDFGTIESGEPILRNHKLNIFSPSKKGYTVFVFQDHALSSESNTQIPNTSCDSGSCSSILFDIWDLPLTYGYGYMCENKNTCVGSFKQGLYRRLPTSENNESPVSVIKSTGNSETNMVFKVNTAQTQAKESYTNNLYYILTPDY